MITRTSTLSDRLRGTASVLVTAAVVLTVLGPSAARADTILAPLSGAPKTGSVRFPVGVLSGTGTTGGAIFGATLTASFP